MTDDRLQPRRTSRLWWLPEWLWHGVVVGVIVGIILIGLKKLVSRTVDALRVVSIRRLGMRVGRAVWRVSPILGFVFGFTFQRDVLTFARLLTLPWIVGIIGAVASLRLYFGFIAKDRLTRFQGGASSIGSRLWNIVIGGLSKAFFDLAAGLLPFWQDPWIFVVLGLYLALILDVVWMKRWFGRAVRLDSFGESAQQ